MISIFDYQGGRGGGKELGGRVFAYANKVGAKFEKTRQVSNPKFTGTVTLYEEETLDEYNKLYPGELKKAIIGTNR